MEATVFLDLSTKQLTDTLGGSRWNFPTLSYREEITLGLRFSKREAGLITEVSRDVDELRCSIGRVDARPESGQWGFEIVPSSGDIVSGLAHNVRGSELQTAINALTLPAGLGDCTVEEKSGSYLIRWEDETVASTDTPVSIVASTTNSLFPISFVRHRTFQENAMWVHELRLIQAPVASTSLSSRILPPPPVISTVQNGGEDEGSGAVWNEIQDLYLPPTFRGLYQIKRGFKRTGLLDISDGVAEIAEAMEALTDEGGVFIVTNPTTDHAHIQFSGTMGGIDQDPLEIEVYSAPEGDLTFTLSLDRPELAALLRRDAEVVLPIEISADIVDENDEEIVRNRKLYRGEVTIRRELHWEELSTAANIEWLRPPLNEQYGGFDYSQVSNGQLHYADAYGDGAATSFVVDHNLDAADVDVVVKDASSGVFLVLGTDYSVTVTNSNSLTVTSLVGAPALNDWRIAVVGLAETSYFDPHTHPVSDISGLQTILDDLGTRLGDLEARAGVGSLPVRSASDTGIAAQWQLPEIFEIFPARVTVEQPAGRLVDLDVAELGKANLGLLAAVHDASVEALTVPAPAVSASFVGRVFQNQTGSTVRLPGGKGHKSVDLLANEYAACDGRLWYPVTRYGEHASGTIFTTNYVADANQLNATDHELSNGSIVRLTTTGTLPGGLATGTNYFVVNRTEDALELSATSGGSPITLTTNGSGTHTVTRHTETSYYPENFERTLFTIHVSERQLRLRKKFEVRFAMEMAVLKANTSAFWTLVIEVGERTQATSPATTGANLAAIVWRGTPLLEERITIGPVSAIHQFGMRVERALVSSVDTLTATGLLYGDEVGGIVPPKSANFALRARLIRFDTEDGQSAPTGFAAIRGLSLSSQGVTNHGAAEVS